MGILKMNKRTQFIYNSLKKNLKIWIKFSLGYKEHVAGNRFIDSDESQVIQTVENLFERYLEYGSFTIEEIRGESILELGPGDSFGIGLKFLFCGAEKVVCFDKFYARRDNVLLEKVYKKMFTQQVNFTFDQVFDKNLIPKGGGLHYYFGKGIEHINIHKKARISAESFDLIVSNQVVQEIYNPFPSLKKMIGLLKNGGKMIHYIDFEPYNYFRYHLKKEYEYLTFPECIYKWMVNKRGMGNRKRITEYINYLNQIEDITFSFIVDRCFLDKQMLKEPIIYPNFPSEVKAFYTPILKNQLGRFARKYQQLPLEDFMVGNAFLIIHKKTN